MFFYLRKNEYYREDEYKYKCGLAKGKIAIAISRKKRITTDLEHLLLDATKEQLKDLFEMIKSDLKDLNNCLESIKGITHLIITN